MQIKDINVSVERLDEVRGGQTINVGNYAAQIGGNSAHSAASGFGVGNQTASGVTQIAPQSLTQSVGINALESHSVERTISNSVVGFGWYF